MRARRGAAPALAVAVVSEVSAECSVRRAAPGGERGGGQSEGARQPRGRRAARGRDRHLWLGAGRRRRANARALCGRRLRAARRDQVVHARRLGRQGLCGVARRASLRARQPLRQGDAATLQVCALCLNSHFACFFLLL